MKETILVEATQFDRIGGWVIDHQFMDQMHAPFLLAHGFGNPVEDATTVIEVLNSGEYHVWVRTRNWTATWNDTDIETPGRFKLLIDGTAIDTTFGTEKAKWHWQYGGSLHIEKGAHKLSLHDLTGFDGRCDSIVFSKNQDIVLPDTKPEFEEFRNRYKGEAPLEEHHFDFVVVGGGVAGICASVAAARQGLKVALIHNRRILGGNNSSEVRVQLGGKVNLPPYEAIGNVVNEIDHKTNRNARPAEEYRDDLKKNIIENEKNITAFLDTHVTDVEVGGAKIQSVIGLEIRTGVKHKIRAPLFSDCSGDANLGFLAGADFRIGRESSAETGESLAPEEEDQMTLGTSVMWYSEESDYPESFPETPWALQFTEDTCQKAKKGDWDWETGMGRNHIDDFEYIRDYALMAVYGNWSFLKNHSSLQDEYKNRRLEWVAYIGGKRESRRLMGDVIIHQQDIDSKRIFPDGCVTTSWSIDLHQPKHIEGFDLEPFRARAKKARIEPFTIPFRALYSRNIENMFMAGRNISVTHVALGTVRVMKTTGMMGEVVGLAADLCTRKKTLPKEIVKDHLNELKTILEAGVPPKFDNSEAAEK